MNAIERAEELRQDAIKLLLAEQEVLGEKLLQLGYDQENSPSSSDGADAQKQQQNRMLP